MHAMPAPELRASDDDRERVVSALGTHLAAGRLDQAEFEERMNAAYAARTFGELDVLTRDLPAPAPEGALPVAADEEKAAAAPAHGLPHGGHGPRGMRGLSPFRTWLLASTSTTAIWGMASAGTGDLQPFWPMWVIVPWGIGMAFQHGRRRGDR
jgi:hypothetical protein